MWILNVIPAFVFYAVIVIAILAIITNNLLPLIYRMPSNLLMSIFLGISTWSLGVKWQQDIFTQKWEELEHKAQLAEEKAKLATSRVEYVFLDRVKTVKETQVVVQQQLKEVKVHIDKNCKIVPEVVELHNKAAR